MRRSPESKRGRCIGNCSQGNQWHFRIGGYGVVRDGVQRVSVHTRVHRTEIASCDISWEGNCCSRGTKTNVKVPRIRQDWASGAPSHTKAADHVYQLGNHVSVWMEKQINNALLNTKIHLPYWASVRNRILDLPRKNQEEYGKETTLRKWSHTLKHRKRSQLTSWCL